MRDVAKLAGVSHQTVSRVLNDHPSVRTSTRLRVRAAMAELEYRPNSAARALVTGRSRMVGIIAQNTTLYGPVSMLSAVQRALDRAQLEVGIVSVSQLDRASIVAAVERLLAQRVGGIVLLAPVHSANDAIDDLPRDLPFVAVDADPDRLHRVVTLDQATGARLATEHLLSLGHRTVWHVAGPSDWYDSVQRTLGWQQALEAGGHTEPPVIHADWSLASGYEAGQVLARVPEATAVFAANDHLAIGVVKALREAGRSIPGEVSVVGFDDIPECRYLEPALTTLRPDFDAVAKRATAVLRQQMSPNADLLPGPPATAHAATPRLVLRDSVAPPPSRRG